MQQQLNKFNAQHNIEMSIKSGFFNEQHEFRAMKIRKKKIEKGMNVVVLLKDSELNPSVNNE